MSRAAAVKPRGGTPASGKPRTGKPRSNTPPGEIRLIGGQWKRTKIAVPAREGLRPTPDRVRETLFNWLGQDLTGWRVLDAFAGTGALGLEAASRGATKVVLIESDSALIPPLHALVGRLGAANIVSVVMTDALTWMARAGRGGSATSAELFDLIFLDPPFAKQWQQRAATSALGLLKPGGFVYVEADAELAPPAGAQAYRQLRAGAVFAHLWRKDDASSQPGGQDAAAKLDALSPVTAPPPEEPIQ